MKYKYNLESVDKAELTCELTCLSISVYIVNYTSQLSLALI